ncbi:MAG: hypothetical protein IKM26_07895 [Clostridia bacterium]|nr:hypothetical protein [Clostridia bacterium]
MKRLEQLPEMTSDMLGGLHATQDLKKEILRDAKAAMQDGKTHYRNSAWESKKVNANTRRQRSVLQRSLAMACMVIVLLGSVVGFPTLIGLDVKNKQNIVTTQMGGDLSNAQSQALDLPQGSIVISQRSAPSYRGIWAAASGANFPLICVEGRYYRLLTNPTSIGTELLGTELGAVSTYTSEPALKSEGVVSNTVQEGGKVYAVSGMNGAMVAAEVEGKMRVFQRVTFGGNALVGGEKLADTLKAGKVVAMELTDVGTVTDKTKAKELYEILINNAVLSRSGASETGTSLLIQLENGLALQLAVRDESVMACGTWTCPEFFEAFEAAVQ